MIKRDNATERQVQAANPATSTWLSANAGSGKTRVLTDRVARLLLDEVLPQHILCLTYTKAAASEMQNRLFERLGAWAMQESDALRQELRVLGVGGQIDDDRLRMARQLFARAIETPGGLKIQTIHSFCASLLRRFPLESRVSPQFSEMDDRSAKLLRQEIVEELAGGQDVAAVDAVAAYYSGEDFDILTQEITRFRRSFSEHVDADKIWREFGLVAGFSEQDVIDTLLTGRETELFTALINALTTGSDNDVKAAKKLAGIDPDNLTMRDLPILEGAFLWGKDSKSGPFQAKIDRFPTRNTRDSLGNYMPALNDLMERVQEARSNRIRLYAAQKTLALHVFAHAFLPRYEQQKQQRGWLDFDDLILKAGALLNDPAVAQWVLFRLDGGIDHILVDEAQDTSPAQWDVIRSLAQEFTSGQGARADVSRTIFVVGDKKQSIYSFQGADPEAFDEMRQHFDKRLAQIGSPLASLELEHSFRSASAILRLVDCTFQDQMGQGLGNHVSHVAFKSDMPGRVDLWPVEEESEAEEEKEWFDPVDKIARNHHFVRLANRIAQEIRRLIDTAQTIPQETGNSGVFGRRPVTPGDFLILVQRRNKLFHEVIRACKENGLPIAGADRLKIGGELAVKDITALLSFLATPEDSLSLAAALRSPLFGWSESRIYDLAQGRAETHLWQTLRNRRESYSDAFDTLDDLRRHADFLRPYELIERVLTRHGGRKALLARLGAEAEDGIDALLIQSLNYERTEIPSLTGFLSWLQTDEVEIKRQMDSAGDQIRVMTVHGAKGLEAPIVILPDTAQRKIAVRNEVLALNGEAVWKTPATQSPEAITQAVDNLREREVEERRRLLYVAMTRAEKWLIVCGAGKLGKNRDSWYETIEIGMRHAGAWKQDFSGGEGLRLEEGAWDNGELLTTGTSTVAESPLPKWAQNPATIPNRPVKPLAPSGLGGAKALAGESDSGDEDAAMLRGSQLHHLLEHLPHYPRESWTQQAVNLLSHGELAASPAVAKSLLSEAAQVLTAPDLAFLFNGDALTEVDVTATLPQLGNARILGAIDCLIVAPDRILVVDFKSNALVPESADQVPEGVLRQMGAYAAATAQIFPDRDVSVAILWTRTATLMPLDYHRVMAALARAAAP